MTCPICGEKTKVSESRAENDYVRRRRVCLRCRLAFVTVEIDEDLYKRIINVKDSQDRNALSRTVDDRH